MGTVEFDEDSSASTLVSVSRPAVKERERAGMIGILRRMRIIQDERKGDWILIGIIACSLIASAIVLSVFVFRHIPLTATQITHIAQIQVSANR